MLYFRNSNISRDVVDNRQRLSVRITPHVENTRSLAVLVAASERVLVPVISWPNATSLAACDD
jgi:hypothetical protein